ncbi:glycosyl hydrolase family 81 [Colletotrichum cuscutae]|uniref:glucan endo-1,3-beta-D-glucosidase n=1 Tax=Colletotrichum cuscutae TaxID=1209917 RepID=A0AAI9TYF6_9PEZI|nr:glycosyl hydrolase family 81 [Colletotrichum cuscutae]
MFSKTIVAVTLLFGGVQSHRHHGFHSHSEMRRSFIHNASADGEAARGGSDNVFVKISHDRPIQVPSRADHPQKPGHGLSISHTDRRNFIYGPGEPVQSFEDPFFDQSIALSARELQNGTVLTTDTLKAFSANVNLATRKGAKPIVSFPVVQGMAFVTGVYNDATVLIQSQKHFSNITDLRLSSNGLGATVYGWDARLGDGSSWLIYINPTSMSERPTLRMTDKGTILGPKQFTGTIQVAKVPAGKAGIDIFSKAAGAYPVGATLSGSVSGKTGTYTLAWEKKGIKERSLLMFALPHHVKSFDQKTARGLTNITLASTTKGIATATLADEFTMVEPELPTDMGFDPWSPRLGSVGSAGSAAIVSEDAKAAIINAAKIELARDITTLTNLTSKYYAGIAFSVYARAIYAVNNIAGDTSFTASSLTKLEAAFDRYVNNQEPNPLFYDDVWKGLVSSGSYGNNDSSIDFGNTYYNDHNFHYGYYVYAAAIIAHFNPSWLTKNDGLNKIWVNNLIRDWSNPSTEDPFFPFSRNFDWFHGHSWARGVLEAPDGKDQESSAEDAFSTLQSYFLLASDNDVQPPNFIGNRATGILWDRKINHTTYFGDEIAYIQGIHMLPIVPSSAYVRKASFVREEWHQYFAGNKSGSLTSGGFAGHMYANLAIADKAGAVESYEFMRKQTPDSPYLSGVSLTWNLAYTAALGGSLGSNSTLNSTSRAV